MSDTKGRDFDQPAKVASKRQEAAAQRRQAILEAALDVFATQGFAAARLEDISEKAGVGKGTIYLSFKDKEDLFEQLLVSALAPVLERAEALAAMPDMRFGELLEHMFAFFRSHILATPRREVIRLVLTEGRRFPRIAEIYHRDVITRGLELIRREARKAHRRGELATDEFVRFPHLVVAPLVLSLIWDGVFSSIEPLDVENLLRAHRQLVVRSAGKSRKA